MKLGCSPQSSHSVCSKRTVHLYGVNIIYIHEFVVVNDSSFAPFMMKVCKPK